jgi:hypothetical protein
MIAEKRGLDPELFVRLINQESGFDPNRRGAAGEIGLGQILPTTNADPGFGVKPANDLFDPVDNLVFSANYLLAMINNFEGDLEKGVAAYNTGAGNVEKGIIPKSTQNYLKNVLKGGTSSAPNEPVPESVPSDMDTSGIDAATRRRIDKVTEQLFGRKSSPRVGKAGITRIGRPSQMSPLSRMGIPGSGNIASYSTPGIPSLMKAIRANQNKVTKI